MAGIFVNIPVLNEVDNVGPLVSGIEAALAGRDYTLLFIDDGSTDGTVPLIRQLQTKNPQIELIERKKTRHGCQRGGALLTGMLWGLDHTNHTVFVEMDGDMSHRPEELPLGLAAIEGGSDLVIASKYLPQSATVRRPVSRRAISAICNVAVRLLITPQITDYSNGYRFYARKVAETIARYQIQYSSPIYLTEVMGICFSNGFKVSEFPSIYVGRYEGLSKLRPIDLVKGALAIFAIATRYHALGFRTRSEPAAKA